MQRNLFLDISLNPPLLDETGEYLNLSRADVTPELRNQILRLIATHPTKVKTLILNDCPLNDEAVEFLRFILKKNTRLKTLELANCELSERAGNHLIRAIVRNKTLCALNLKNNHFSEALGERLVALTRNNETLLECKVDARVLNEEQKFLLDYFLQRNQFILDGECASGDTALHILLDEATNDTQDIYNYLTGAGKLLTETLLNCPDVAGRTPLQCLEANKNPLLSTEIRNELADIFLRLLLTPDCKRLSQKINFSEVVERYQPEPDSHLYHSLYLACHIANEVRKLYKASATHPSSNALPFKEIVRLHERNEQLRLQANLLRCETARLNKGSDKWEKVLAVEASLFEAEGIGNCQEFSISAFKLALKFNPAITAGVYRLIGGDHVVLVLGTGNERVVCDPWFLDVFPIEYSFLRFRNHVPHVLYREDLIPEIYNLTSYVNPNFQSLELRPLLDEPFERELFIPTTPLLTTIGLFANKYRPSIYPEDVPHSQIKQVP